MLCVILLLAKVIAVVVAVREDESQDAQVENDSSRNNAHTCYRFQDMLEGDFNVYA